VNSQALRTQATPSFSPFAFELGLNPVFHLPYVVPITSFAPIHPLTNHDPIQQLEQLFESPDEAAWTLESLNTTDNASCTASTIFSPVQASLAATNVTISPSPLSPNLATAVGPSNIADPKPILKCPICDETFHRRYLLPSRTTLLGIGPILVGRMFHNLHFHSIDVMCLRTPHVYNPVYLLCRTINTVLICSC
jgi:hypothetical protein